MSVVNVKVKYIRPQYKNLAEWMADTNNVYIGRKGVVFINGERFPKQDSIWANPFKIGQLSREEVIQKYEIYIRQKIKDEHLENDILQLNGKQLGCWCTPDFCHGDILIKILTELYKPMRHGKEHSIENCINDSFNSGSPIATKPMSEKFLHK